MDPYSSPDIIPNNSPHNPFPHSLVRTRQFSVECPGRPFGHPARKVSCKYLASLFNECLGSFLEFGGPGVKAGLYEFLL